MQEIHIYTNTLSGEHYDLTGKSYRKGTPEIYVNSRFMVYWQLYSSTPGANLESVDVATWTKNEKFAGCVAKLTCDNDWIKNVIGSLSAGNEIATGKQFPATVTISVNSSEIEDIAPSGQLTFYNTHGEYQSVLYTSKEFQGNTVIFTIDNQGTEAKYSYSEGDSVGITQEVLFQSFCDTDLSNPENGLFVFEVIASSGKLHRLSNATTAGSVAIKGIELLPYIVAEDNTIVQYPSFIFTKAALLTTMAEAGTPAQPGDILKSEIAAEIKKQLAESGGSGGGASSADKLPVTDVGNYFTSENVEGALQEIGATLNGLEAELAEV